MTDEALAVVVPLELVERLLRHLDTLANDQEALGWEASARKIRADRDWLNALPECRIAGVPDD